MIINLKSFFRSSFLFRVLNRLKNKLNLLNEYYYDFKIYYKYNSNRDKMNLRQLESRIIAHYHVLEKGFVHPKPKKCFSLPLVESLIGHVHAYDKLCDERSRQVNVAVELLKKYRQFNDSCKCINNDLDNKLKNLDVKSKFDPGVIQTSSSDYFKNSESAFDKFAMSRYSVRDFTNVDVSVDTIVSAIKVAQKTPSVCNRQTSKVYILCKKDDINSHLSYQNGNRGFGDKINKLLIITSDINCFFGPEERNQAFIDGGMFAMSLLYSLHHKKIGAVTLNWAYNSAQNEALHNLCVIPRNEKVILFIGIGNVPATFKVAVSDRRDINEVVNII